MYKDRFRQGVLYALPNGEEFLVLAGEDGSLNLCRPEEGTEESQIDYRLSPDGRIYRRGTRTNWGAGDITDTGRTVMVKKVFAGS